MPKNDPDTVSVETVCAVLDALRCPNVRRAEGTDEWRQCQGTYRFSPDLVAGPLVGGGDPSDFYVEVFAPQGDRFVNPLAGNPQAAVAVLRAVAERGSFNLGELGDTAEQLLKRMNEKLTKYVGFRDSTPMLGLAMYFTMTGNQKVGPVIAGYQAPTILDRAFGITHHLGQSAMDTIMREVMTGEPSPGHSGVVLSLPIAQALSFVLYVARKTDRPRAVLLVNEAAADPAHKYASHPVIQWLRALTTSSA